jgi:hypothetical protein
VFDEVMRGLVEAASPGFSLHGAVVSLCTRRAMSTRPGLWKLPHRNKAPAVCQR